MAFFSLAALRMVLDTETDADSPGSEELLSQIRENFEALMMLLLDTGITTTCTGISETVFTDSGSPFANVEVGMTLLITSGVAKGKIYTIDATNNTTTVTCTGDTLSSDGVVATDTAKVLYDLKVNTDGHDHDGVNAKKVATIATGAVDQDAIGASAVGQSEIKSTTAAQSVAVVAGANNSITLTGGTYAFLTVSANSPLSAGNSGVMHGGGNTAAGVVGFYNGHGSVSYTAYVDQRYIQASPPYDMGDGEVALFVYVLMDSLGKMQGISVGKDPTWAYHGPTDIVPSHKIKGKPYREFKMLEGVPFAEAMKIPKTVNRYMRGEIEITYSLDEITHAVKNKDMEIAPHPYIYNNLKGLTPVLLDPMSSITEKLAIMTEEMGAMEVLRLIENKYLTIGNEAIKRKCPKAVMPVTVNWRQKKGS